MDGDEDLGDLLAQRPLTVALELILERRVRLYADRLNRRLGESSDSDLYNVDEDEDLAQIVMLLCEIALEADERRSGLAADPLTGEMRSRELVEERARRRTRPSRPH
jgi:hypothetical protein